LSGSGQGLGVADPYLSWRALPIYR